MIYNVYYTYLYFPIQITINLTSLAPYRQNYPAPRVALDLEGKHLPIATKVCVCVSEIEREKKRQRERKRKRERKKRGKERGKKGSKEREGKREREKPNRERERERFIPLLFDTEERHLCTYSNQKRLK